MCAEVSSAVASPSLRQAEVEVAIRGEHPTARDFKWSQILTGFLDSSVHYVAYSADDQDEADAYSYVHADSKGGFKLYDDGVKVIEGLQGILDKRRSFLQRLGDFTFFDFIAALIAIAVTVTFVYLVIWVPNQSKDFGSVFGIVAGYYFGKNVSTK